MPIDTEYKQMYDEINSATPSSQIPIYWRNRHYKLFGDYMRPF